MQLRAGFGCEATSRSETRKKVPTSSEGRERGRRGASGRGGRAQPWATLEGRRTAVKDQARRGTACGPFCSSVPPVPPPFTFTGSSLPRSPPLLLLLQLLHHVSPSLPSLLSSVSRWSRRASPIELAHSGRSRRRLVGVCWGLRGTQPALPRDSAATTGRIGGHARRTRERGGVGQPLSAGVRTGTTLGCCALRTRCSKALGTSGGALKGHATARRRRPQTSSLHLRDPC